MSRLLDILERSGVLPPLDVALGRLLEEKSPHNGGIIGLAGAVTSFALSHAHSCLPLTQLAGLLQEAGYDNKEFPALPDIDTLRTALRESPLVAHHAAPTTPLIFDNYDRLYLRRYWCYEQLLARKLHSKIISVNTALDPLTLRITLARFFPSDGSTINWQALAVLAALRSRFTLITGGPGTGKTTSVLGLLALLVEQAFATNAPIPRIALAAPTGKAAARLSATIAARKSTLVTEAHIQAVIPEQAITLHRLLGGRPGGQKFRHHHDNPLNIDVLIIDEASMLDLPLAAHLLDALRDDTRLILLGDANQLASVEAGSVLGALHEALGPANTFSAEFSAWTQTIIDTGLLPSSTHLGSDTIIELNESWRFTKASAMGRFADAVRRGDTHEAHTILDSRDPALSWENKSTTLFSARLNQLATHYYAPLLTCDDPHSALETAERYRILTAVRHGAFGCITLNAMIEAALRLRAKQRSGEWFHGRLVLIVTNDYCNNLYNGDLGIALATGAQAALEIWFRGESNSLRSFTPQQIPAHESAFAMTVHKSQGSEFDEVLVVLPEYDNRLLARELLYTAITRARQRVTLWATPAAVSNTIARSTQRWSGLTEALKVMRENS